MQFYNKPTEKFNAGLKDYTTGRYIPMGGGTSSRLSYLDDPEIRRYWGFVGIDESKSYEMPTIVELIRYLSGGVYIPEGPAGEFIKLILAQAHNWDKELLDETQAH